MHRIGESWEKGEGGRNHSGKTETKTKPHVVAGDRPGPPQQDSWSESSGTPQNGGGWDQAACMK